MGVATEKEGLRTTLRKTYSDNAGEHERLADGSIESIIAMLVAGSRAGLSTPQRNRINTLQGGALRPPYRKRMCAWMQARLIARMTRSLKLDVERFDQWVRSNESAAGTYAMILDFRREPMYRAAEMSLSGFREEILDRLVALRLRHEAVGRMMPRKGEMDRAVVALAERGSLLGFPGPLEGHKRPALLGGRAMPEAQAEEIWKKFVSNLVEPAWPALAYVSQIFDFGEKFLGRLRELVGQVNITDKNQDQEKRLGHLADICLLAAAHRDRKLADVFAAKALACTEGPCSEQKAVAILRAILVAGAAFENEKARAKWLEERLSDLAVRLPRGEASQVFLEHLWEIKKGIKVSLRILARAEALATAAN